MTGEAWSVQGLPGIPREWGGKEYGQQYQVVRTKITTKVQVTLKVIIMTKKEGNVFSFVTDSITFPFPKLFF